MAQEYIRRLIITGPEVDQTIDLKVGSYVIGRQAGSTIRLNHPMISRSHAQVECTAEGCQVIDLGSANGSSLNGQPLEANKPVQLSNGAKIQAGPFELLFEEIAVFVEEPEPKPKPKAKPKPATKPKAEPEVKEEPKKEPPKPAGPPSIPPRGPAIIEKEFDYSQPPPGLSRHESRFMEYLPGIYHTDFMARFLAIFEAVLTPIEWTVDNFDLYLNPHTTPTGFLPWLANWFSITFDSTWSEEQQRLLLSEAHEIFARRGTRWALARVLEIYTGQEPEILDQEEKEDAFTFTVKLPVTEAEYQRTLIEQIVDANKPAHTNYKLEFAKNSRKKS